MMNDEADDEPKRGNSGAWMICWTCNGDGGHSRRLGAITSEDWHDNWDEDERADYMRGGYDETCQTCKGSGKVREGDERADRAHDALIERESRGGDGRFNGDGEPMW